MPHVDEELMSDAMEIVPLQNTLEANTACHIPDVVDLGLLYKKDNLQKD